MLKINKINYYILYLTVGAICGVVFIEGIFPIVPRIVLHYFRKSPGSIILVSVFALLGLAIGVFFDNFSKIFKNKYEKACFFVCFLCCVLSASLRIYNLPIETPPCYISGVILGRAVRWSLICCLSVIVLKVIALLRRCYSKNL